MSDQARTSDPGTQIRSIVAAYGGASQHDVGSFRTVIQKLRRGSALANEGVALIESFASAND
jgi:hypothetical protein